MSGGREGIAAERQAGIAAERQTGIVAQRQAGIAAERHAASVPRVRAWVAGVLTAWGVPGGTCTDAVLLAGELLANATRHGQGAVLAVDLGWEGGRVHCAVATEGEGVPRMLDTGWWSESGRGLVLVDAMASAWGSQVVPGGRCVWFDMTVGDEA